MITRSLKFLFSRPMLAIYLLYLQVGHIHHTWFDNDPQLGTLLHCVNWKQFSIRSDNNDEVATARRFYCAFSARNPTVYVYLHGVNDPERSWNVVFKYRGADPAIVWEAAHRIRITVAGPIEIAKQLVLHDQDAIAYTLTGSDAGE